MYDAYRRRGVAPARVEYEDFAESVDITLRAAAQPTTLTNEEIDKLAVIADQSVRDSAWAGYFARLVEAEVLRRMGVVG